MSDIKLITLTSYTRPPLMEDKSRDWVMNGRNNEYYNYIVDRNNGSPTNSSINQSYSTLIYGKGLRTSSGSLGAENWGRLQTILRPRELRKMIADFQVFGEFSFEVIETKGGDLHSLTHIPKQMVIPSIANEKNEIERYWFSRNWRKYTDVENTPVSYNAYGAARGNSIYVAKPYVVGAEYFGSPSYSAGLVFADMEEEIANTQISSIKNGLSAGYIIQIPNGTNYTPEEKEEFERQVKRKLTSSSNASNFIISFNDQEVAIQVTPFPVNSNVHKQWEALQDQCKTQIMTAHKVISPSLVGLSSTSGFSSVADEMDMSERQTIKRVIKPKQDFILDAIEEVLVNYGINLDLYFAPLTEEVVEVKEETAELSSHVCMSENIELESYNDYPEAAKNNAKRALKWVEKNGWGSCGEATGKKRANQIANGENLSKDTISRMASFKRHQQHKDVPYSEGCGGLMWDSWGGSAGVNWAISKMKELNMSTHVCMSDGAPAELADSLIELGETLDVSEWTMLSSAYVDYDTDGDLYDLVQFATSTGTARPNSKSVQDNKDIAIRYRYVGNKSPQREFCRKMMQANKLYRKEDILQMNKAGVNDGFGLGGSNSYSIWLYKGGGRMSANFPQGTCRHKWQREIYLKNGSGLDVNSPLAKTISTSEARRKGYKVPTNESIVSIKPHNA